MLVMTLLPNLKWWIFFIFIIIICLKLISSMKMHCRVRKYSVFEKRLFTEKSVQIYFIYIFIFLMYILGHRFNSLLRLALRGKHRQRLS